MAGFAGGWSDFDSVELDPCVRLMATCLVGEPDHEIRRLLLFLEQSQEGQRGDETARSIGTEVEHLVDHPAEANGRKDVFLVSVDSSKVFHEPRERQLSTKPQLNENESGPDPQCQV